MRGGKGTFQGAKITPENVPGLTMPDYTIEWRSNEITRETKGIKGLSGGGTGGMGTKTVSTSMN